MSGTTAAGAAKAAGWPTTTISWRTGVPWGTQTTNTRLNSWANATISLIKLWVKSPHTHASENPSTKWSLEFASSLWTSPSVQAAGATLAPVLWRGLMAAALVWITLSLSLVTSYVMEKKKLTIMIRMKRITMTATSSQALLQHAKSTNGGTAATKPQRDASMTLASLTGSSRILGAPGGAMAASSKLRWQTALVSVVSMKLLSTPTGLRICMLEQPIAFSAYIIYLGPFLYK